MQTEQETAGVSADPRDSAKAAGLRYTMDSRPGIARKRAGKGFSYFAPDGQPVKDKAELERIKSLKIPPAWKDVWINPLRNGHLQATGHDDRGRKQYIYHPRWREVRDENKFERMVAFAQALPEIRQRVAEDMARPGLPREKVLATVVKLLETTLIRVGNEEYARENESYGLTTMLDHHAEVAGSCIHFQFRGKRGKFHDIGTCDRRLSRVIKRSQELPGEELFQYIGDDGEPHSIESADVNAYLKEITGEDFTAKDFRTWAGTVLAALALKDSEPAEKQSQARKTISRAVKNVAEQLGNTPAIARKSYIHPAVLRSYQDGALADALMREITEEVESEYSLQPEEKALLDMLQQKLENPGKNDR